MNLKIDDNNEIVFGLNNNDDISMDVGDTIDLGTKDYNELTNKPSIEGIELIGDVSLDDLGVAFVDDIPTEVSELVNDAGYITSADIPPIPDKTSELVNDSGFITSPNVVYCTCATAGGTAAKVADIVSGTLTELHTGDQAIVKFTNANSVANPTLNIAGTGAKSIKRYGTTAPSTSAATSWNAGNSFLFVYDGTYWQMVSWINTTYSEITEANITNGTSSTTGLISGRRMKKAIDTFVPPMLPTALSDLDNDEGFITEDDIPPIPTELKDLEVTDLGDVDLEEYDWDIEAYLNTITETGMYKFNADGLEYFVYVESLDTDELLFVYQEYWGTEEGPRYNFPRYVVYEDGEVIDSGTMSYLSTEEAYMNFATKIHMHCRYEQGTKSVWAFIEETYSFSNENPFVIYADTKSGQSWLIEGFYAFRTPNERIIKVYPMFDSSVFYQRSGQYVNKVFVWDANYYQFSGQIFTP